MENNKSHTENHVRRNHPILCGGLFDGPRLTPTGKISHAKTRVYTQRYRKEWEQMPDFRGWLTSVPNQATRAYCTFCKKNLHAHRLSLLKHTCTMKHQRAALMYQNEMSTQERIPKSIDLEPGYEEDVNLEDVIPKEPDAECEEEEDTEEFEYVVETLEMEEDELDDSRCKEQHGGSENPDDYDEENGTNICASNEVYHSPEERKIKIERQEQDDSSCDPLAEAMAHVHGEYLVSTDEQANAEEMEMVVSQEEAGPDMENDTSMNSIEDDGEGDGDGDGEAEGDGDDSQNNDTEDLKRSDGDSSEAGSESEISSAQRFEEFGKSFKNLKQVFNSKLSGNSAFGTPVSIPSGQTKTLKLNSGKTVTLKAGTQYVLSNMKGDNISSLLMTDRKNAIKSDDSTKSGQSPKPNSKTTKLNPYALSLGAGTSKQSSSQECTKSGGTKKPCISTHVMDTSKGLPIGGLQVSLYKLMDGRWTFLNESNTSPNGRCNDLVDNSKSNFTAGRYKMHFDVDKYFTLRRIETMYPFIEIVFDVKNPTGNYHIPVLLSPFGYTTYRGSDR